MLLKESEPTKGAGEENKHSRQEGGPEPNNLLPVTLPYEK